MRRIAACAILAVSVAIGGGRATTPVTDGPMRIVGPTSDPPSRGLGRGPANLVFVSPRVGFAATTGGGHMVAHVGWVAPIEPGRIQRTDDGGRTWRTVWSGPGVVFQSIAAHGSTIVAGGALSLSAFPKKHCRFDFDEPCGRRVLVASPDGGRTWRERTPPPVRGSVVRAVTSSVWLAVGLRPPYGPEIASVYRTSDAGAHWRRVGFPWHAMAVRFANARVALAAAPGRSCPSGSQLWRSSDGASTWRPMARTCGPPVADLDVLSEGVALVARTDEDRESSLVQRTTDGGLTWRTILRTRRNRPVEHVDFTDGRHGFVLGYRLDERPRGDRATLRTTADAGRTWRFGTLPYAYSPYETATDPGPLPPTAFAAGGRAWVGDDRSPVVWRTTDYGRTWRMSTGALDPWPVMAFAPGVVVVSTDSGFASSVDDGGRWIPGDRPTARSVAIGNRTNAVLQWTLRRTVIVTGDEGRSWQWLRAPVAVDYAAFTTFQDGLIAGDHDVLATHDGGRTWRRLVLLGRSPLPLVGPDVVVLVGPTRVHISTNEGATWHVLRTAKRLIVSRGAEACSVARPLLAAIWLLCAAGSESRRTTVLLVTRDGGRSWTRRTSRLQLPVLVAATAERAWAMAEDDDEVRFHNGRAHDWLLRTTDGGATWRRMRIALTPWARTRQTTAG